jgi:hypothetical protein
LGTDRIDGMFALFKRYYLRTTLEIFQKDLSKKNWCILLYSEADQTLQGFTTLHFFESAHEGHMIGIVYSGDTIIDKAYWGSPTLSQMWIKTVLEVGEDYPKPLYWLLICSGYKTYRFLPLFYKEYYPHYKRPTPSEMQNLMHKLAGDYFGSEYHPNLGIVRFEEGSTPLVEGIGEIDKKRLKNPHIRFFAEVNPGHVDGDELVCLTLIDEDNLTKAGRRMLP